MGGHENPDRALRDIQHRRSSVEFNVISMRLRWTVLWILVVLFAAAAVGFLFLPAGKQDPRRFDPDRSAALEVAMWRAYYDKRHVALMTDLVTMVRERYGCSWARATRMGFYIARAAARFGDMRSDYDRVLPDLEAAYRIARDWTGASYDPASVARAELAWWVARRVPGEDSPEQVGGLMADLNAQLYGVPRDRVLEASILRARAGKLRDAGGARAAWSEVSRLLQQSYRSLHAAVDSMPVRTN